ncbi:GMC oxidoreductase, partial [Leucobacter soli]|uniref:GMC oxidoreductase n=1 Tax=Leucobacter soli TaxID=2812850 RepID=UPI003621EEFE
VGTVRMAADGAGVVDATLRVTGIEGLRIADTSVLPKQPGNTMAPTYGLAARAAELILADR